MPCKTVPQYLDAVRAKHDIASDSQLAQLLDVSRATVSAWRKGYSLFDDVHSARIADLLGLHPCHMLACVHALKEKDNPEIYKMWVDVARQYEKMGKKKKGQ